MSADRTTPEPRDRCSTDRHVRMLAASAEIGALLLEGDPQAVVPQALELLRRAIGCDQVALRPLHRVNGRWQRGPRTALSNAVGTDAVSLEAVLSDEERDAVDQSIGDLLARGDLARWDDYLEPPVRERVARESGYHDTLAAPVSNAGRLWGVLAISTRDAERSFTEGELEALRLTAQLFSAAFHRAEATDARQRSEQMMEAVARVATDPDAHASPERIARRLAVELAAATGRPRVLVERVVSRSGAVETIACSTREAGLTTGVVRLESVLAVPVRVDGRLWGRIVVADTPGARPLDEARTEAVRIAAGLVAAVATRAATEEALRESQAMLLHAQKLEAIGLFAGGVAHDFSNTLMATRGFAVLIEETSREEETREYARQISAAAERSSALLRRLLDLARRSPGGAAVSDPAQMLSSFRALLTGVVPRRISLTVTAEPGTPLVEIDPDEFEQVALNLVLNACDAIGDAIGAITVRARGRDDGRLELTVEDTGAGIAPDVLERIFDPFFTTKDRSRGSGIGLTVVQGIVSRAGGTIGATSMPGAGSRFTIVLPAAAATGTAAEEPVDAPGPSLPELTGERVLLVEDDDRLRPALEGLLRTRGHEVTATASAEEALEQLAGETGFDVLVTDVVMPGLDGRALASRVRETHPGMAVVLMSGYSFESGHEVEGTTFVPKHRSCEALLDAVDDAVRSCAA